jgi:NAD(P)H-hydrate epimerase
MLGGTIAGQRIVLLCGTGNNGGGGMVAARHLVAWGAAVMPVLIGSRNRLKPIPRRQWAILERLGLVIEGRNVPRPRSPDLIIDAVYGYGFHGDPPRRAADWIEWANRRNCPVLALDLPSGLEATTGRPAVPCVRAGATLTLALPKRGLLATQARPYVGDLYLTDLAVPPTIYHSLGIEVGVPFERASIVRLA